MEYRQCGKSEFKFSVIGMGCWAFGGGDYWGPDSQPDTHSVVRAAFEAGINYFDTAEAYNEGRSEIALGKAIAPIGRDQVYIGSKISPCHCYPAMLEQHCEASLKRLGTDYLDLYMIHWPIHAHSIRHFTQDESVINHPPLLEDALAAMELLRAKGKVRQTGVSNFSRQRLMEIPAGTGVVVNELPYNLLCRAIELDTLPYCIQQGMGVIGYMTLMQGILTNRFKELQEVPAWQRRTRHFNASGSTLSRHGETGHEQPTQKTLDSLRLVAAQEGLSLAALATRWVISHPAITCALIGARSVNKLRENVLAAEGRLSPLTIDRLNRLTAGLRDIMGNHFDYYESKENDRT